MLKLTINGAVREVDVPPDMPLLWVLRDELDMTGTKYGCGVAMCGACTVHVDGVPMRSCQFPVGDAQDVSITTIEGVTGDAAEAVRKAWQDLDVVQCGYCQSGQILAAITLLTENRDPNDADIEAALDGNVCRCATYVRIKAAVRQAAETLRA